jgi:hypothetical protein
VLSVVYIIKFFWPNLCTKQCISLMILTEVMPIATKLHRKKFYNIDNWGLVRIHKNPDHRDYGKGTPYHLILILNWLNQFL